MTLNSIRFCYLIMTVNFNAKKLTCCILLLWCYLRTILNYAAKIARNGREFFNSCFTRCGLVQCCVTSRECWVSRTKTCFSSQVIMTDAACDLFEVAFHTFCWIAEGDFIFENHIPNTKCFDCALRKARDMANKTFCNSLATIWEDNGSGEAFCLAPTDGELFVSFCLRYRDIIHTKRWNNCSTSQILN